MKVLWITNMLFPDVCKALNIPALPIGGWMYSSAKCLLKNYDVEIAVAAIAPCCKFQMLEVEGIKYYLLPLKRNPIVYKKKLEKYWIQIENDFSPEIVHIHGTEFSHGLAYMKIGNINRTVISIQGLVSVYERYYYANMDFCDIVKNVTFRDFIKCDNVFQQRRSFQKRGELEKEYISRGRYVIGRTKWDKSHIAAINVNTSYFCCNETLRSSFYQDIWNVKKCERYSIFLSQASYPIKGLHQMLKALPLILKKYPQTRLYIAGANIFQRKTLMDKIKFNGYAKYIQKIIKELGLEQYIVFLGMLDEKDMCERYLKSHVFVCPSAIENSPNSLGEAQLLGVPCIASYVGGTPDMVESHKSGILYRFEEFEMLAENVCEVFSNNELAIHLSENSRLIAAKRHNLKDCTDRLFEIYVDITNNNFVKND